VSSSFGHVQICANVACGRNSTGKNRPDAAKIAIDIAVVVRRDQEESTTPVVMHQGRDRIIEKHEVRRLWKFERMFDTFVSVVAHRRKMGVYNAGASHASLVSLLNKGAGENVVVSRMED
jgi:hypothetical protein